MLSASEEARCCKSSPIPHCQTVHLRSCSISRHSSQSLDFRHRIHRHAFRYLFLVLCPALLHLFPSFPSVSSSLLSFPCVSSSLLFSPFRTSFQSLLDPFSSLFLISTPSSPFLASSGTFFQLFSSRTFSSPRDSQGRLLFIFQLIFSVSARSWRHPGHLFSFSSERLLLSFPHFQFHLAVMFEVISQ